MELRAEQAIARRIGIDWKHRGPTAPEVEDKHATWRGQKFRPGSQRWANNGGARSAWYNTYYPLKRKANDSGKEVDRKRLQQWLAQNPMPEKSTSSGSGGGKSAKGGGKGGTAPSSGSGGGGAGS
jgi:hypothetical protein